MDWYRMYTCARNDAKLRSLSDAQFRTWFNLLCLAAEGTGEERGSIDGANEVLLAVEVAGGDLDLLRATLDRLALLDIVAIDGPRVTFVHFAERQYVKPSARPEAQAERKRKSRAHQRRDPGVTGGGGDAGHTPVTPPSHPEAGASHEVTRPDTETEAESDPAKAGIGGEAPIGPGPGDEPGHEDDPPTKGHQPVSTVPAPDGPFRLLQVLSEVTGFGKGGIARREKDKQAAVAKRLLEEGYTEADVRGCLGFLLSEEWREGIVDLFVVERHIGKWVAAGRPATAGGVRSRRNGRGLAHDYEGTDWAAVKARRESAKHEKAT